MGTGQVPVIQPPPPIPSPKPPRKPRRVKPPVTQRMKPERKIQLEIVHWLQAHGVPLAVTDAGALHHLGTGTCPQCGSKVEVGEHYKCGIPHGWADLTCCFPGGRYVGIEVKSAKGVQSDEQRQHQGIIEAAGGVYLLVRSVEELVADLRTAHKMNLLQFDPDRD